jgi:hypothetical protein
MSHKGVNLNKGSRVHHKDKNEFAIGLKDDEHFRAMTKAGEFYTRFVDVFDQVLNDENEIDRKQVLERWIAAAKKNESCSMLAAAVSSHLLQPSRKDI